jgi:hypothetical protein
VAVGGLCFLAFFATIYLHLSCLLMRTLAQMGFRLPILCSPRQQLDLIAANISNMLTASSYGSWRTSIGQITTASYLWHGLHRSSSSIIIAVRIMKLPPGPGSFEVPSYTQHKSHSKKTARDVDYASVRNTTLCTSPVRQCN